MCNGEFISKKPKKGYDFLEQLARSSQAWEFYEPKKNLAKEKERTSAIGGKKYTLCGEHDTRDILATLARRVEVMEEKKIMEVKSVSNSNEVPYAICDNNTHITHHCPTILGLKEALNEHLYSKNS